MSRTAELLAGLEHQREAGIKAMALRDRALRLAENPDFREIILENFCKNDCARFAQESGDPALTELQRADALAMAQASGHLRRYLRVLLQTAEMFENNMKDLDEQIEEMRAAGDDEPDLEEEDALTLERNEGSVN